MCRQQLAQDDVTGGTRRRCFVSALMACERRSDPPVHFLHRCDIDHARVFDDLTRMLKLVRDEREDVVMADPGLVRRHEDAQISVTLSRSNEWQHTAVDMAEGTNPSFNVDDPIGTVDAGNERSERRRPLCPFFNELEGRAIRRSDARLKVGRRRGWRGEHAYDCGCDDEKLAFEMASPNSDLVTR